jgi:hypothetical protein
MILKISPRLSSINFRTIRQAGPSRVTSLGACFGALVLLAGCASEPESHVVSAPPPTATIRTVTTTTTPVAMAGPTEIVGSPDNVIVANSIPVVSTTLVTQSPPALQPEIVLARPSPRHVWLAGYWTWRDERYEWMAGHWQLPPGSRSNWVAPRWESQGNAYKFTEGYWN